MTRLGRIGIWSRQLRYGEAERSVEAAAELEALGYGAVWMPGGAARDYFPLARKMVGATHGLTVASGILSVWTNSPDDVAEAHTRMRRDHPGRTLLGLGVSHAHLVEAQTGQRYEHPLAVMRSYLGDLAATGRPVPRDELVLAALGPRMLALSRDRSLGAHPYFVSPDHTRMARSVLGSGPLLAPEQAVVLEVDPERARTLARGHMETYLRAPNYTNNLLRIGFAPEDLRHGGSDRLVDAIVAWGDAAAVRRRIDEHFDAGADHVCLQVITADRDALPLAEWRTLADALELRPGA